MFNRAFGWIQNPSSFETLKKTVQIFDSSSSHYNHLKNSLVNDLIIYFDDIRDNIQNKLDRGVDSFSYSELVGTNRDKNNRTPKTRRNAEANALIQISSLPQNHRSSGRQHIDDWSSDGFLRWAVSFNFVEHNRDTDHFTITPLGREFSNTLDDSPEEKTILKQALLSYPPATQVLKILSENTNGCTKFFIGNRLGFYGESGFTSYDENLMIDWLRRATKSQKTDIRTKVEGTSDKYARMIAGWLKKVDLVSTRRVTLSSPSGNFTSFQHYFITAEGEHSLRQINNNSNRYPKYIMWEFLAVKVQNRDYIRTRRAYILKILMNTNSFTILTERLLRLGFMDNEEVIKSDISRLNTFGIRITLDGNYVDLKDSINDFTIPNLNVTSILINREIEELKAYYIENTNIPLKFIELLEISFDNQRHRDFELITIELFREIYGMDAIHLGGQRQPDGIIQTEDFGVLIDTKAYSDGFSIPINQADAMIRYINDNVIRSEERNSITWWENFNENINENQFYFLWISGRFIGNFSNNLEYTANEADIQGGVLNVQQMLIGAHKVQIREFNIEDFPTLFNNDEIIFDHQYEV